MSGLSQLCQSAEQHLDSEEARSLAARVLAAETPSLATLLRAARLLSRLGESVAAEEVAWRAVERHAEQDSTWEMLLRLLPRGGQPKRALDVAREVQARGPCSLRLALLVNQTFHRAGAMEAEKALARAHFVRLCETSGERQLWLARLARLEGDLEAAIGAYTLALGEGSGDTAIKERAWTAFNLGAWGRDAAVLREGLKAAGEGSPLARALTSVDGLLRRFGGSLEHAAARPESFAHVSTPGGVFAYLAATTPTAGADEAERDGLVMVGGSLTGAGSERIMALSFNRYREISPLGPTKLYLYNFAADAPSSFYLPLTGATADEIEVLDPPPEPRVEPFAWLPPAMADRTQAIHQRLLRDRPKAVHAWLDHPNLCAGFAAVAAGVPRIVLHTHSMRPTELGAHVHIRGAAECYRALMERPEVLLVGCGEACLRDYLDWMGRPDHERAVSVYNGYDFGAFDRVAAKAAGAQLRGRLGIADGARMVGTAMRFVEVKRPHRWLDMAAAVVARRPNAHFVMFGDGPLKAGAEAHARQLGIGGRVHFPGHVPDLQRKLAGLDLFVLSSSTEGLPNVLIEAQAAGVPVVSYDVGGVAETMRPGVTGLLVDQDSAEALADAVLRALGRPGWRRDASRQGRDFVRGKFSLDRMMAQLTGLLTAPTH